MTNLKGAVIATTPSDTPRYHYVWLCLPTTVDVAANILNKSKLNNIRLFETKMQSDIWNCVALIGSVDIKYHIAPTIIANFALNVLDELAHEKKLRQQLRITAWLVGHDLNTLFHTTTVDFHTNQERVSHNQGVWLANCIREGIMGNNYLNHVNTKVTRVMWSLAKATDYAFGVAHSIPDANDPNNPAYKKWIQYTNKLTQKAVMPFTCYHVHTTLILNSATTQIYTLCKTEKDPQLGNLATRSKIWRLIAETTIKTMSYAH